VGIEIAADPVRQFLMPIMVGVGERIEKVVKPRDAPSVVRRTGEFPSMQIG